MQIPEEQCAGMEAAHRALGKCTQLRGDMDWVHCKVTGLTGMVVQGLCGHVKFP